MTTSMSNSHNHGTRLAVRRASQRHLNDSSMVLLNSTDSLSVFESSLTDVSLSFYRQKLKTPMNKQKQSEATNAISSPSRSANQMKSAKSSKSTSSIKILSKQKNKSNDSKSAATTPTSPDISTFSISPTAGECLSKQKASTRISTSSIKILSKQKDNSNVSTSAATTPTSTDVSTFSISPTAHQSLSKQKASTPILTSSKTVSAFPTKNNPVAKMLTTTNAIGLKKTSTSSITITKTSGGISLIQDFQKQLKKRDDTIKDLKKKIEERDKTIADFRESSMTIPTEPLVIEWIDHLYEMVHHDEIRDQMNYEDYAERLCMDVNTLKNCIYEKDRVKTAREILRNFPDYQEIIHMDNAWPTINKEQINIVLEFIRKQFGPSLSKTDHVIRTSLSTMVRLASWKVRGDTRAVHPGDNAAQLSGQDDGQYEEENEEEGNEEGKEEEENEEEE